MNKDDAKPKRRGKQDLLTCNEQLREHIKLNLKKFEVQQASGKNLKRAAVALTVVNVAQGPDLNDIPPSGYHPENAALILTRRSLKLKNHAGQWALPGGQIETGEIPVETALRELDEEVGLGLTQKNSLGRLDDFTTRSGFVITPLVFWGGDNVTLTPNPDEVASIHRIPLTEFMRPDAPLLEENPTVSHPILYMPVGRSAIAAPTAALLYQFREVALLGKPTRVAHFEQPFWAWK